MAVDNDKRSGASAFLKDIGSGMFSSVMPVSSNTVRSAKSALYDFKRLSRRLGPAQQSASSSEAEAQPGARKASMLFNKALQDVASGNYGLDRTNDDLYADFGDDISKDFDLENMTTDEQASLSPEQITLNGSRGIAKAVVRSGSAQLEGMSQLSKMMMKNQLKTAQAAVKSINSSIVYGTNAISSQIMVTNTKLDTINANLTKMIQYQNENTSKFYTESLKMFNTMGKLMENMQKYQEGSRANPLGNFDTKNGFDFKKYMEYVKNNYKKSMAGSSSGAIRSAFEAGNIGEMIGSMLGDVIMKRSMPSLVKLDRHVGNMFDEMLKRLKDRADENPLLSMLGIGDILGNRRRKVSGLNMGNYMKDSMMWNGKAQKALTEVIPELLSSIDAGINKTEKRYYDFDKGRFKTKSQIEKDYIDEYTDRFSIAFDESLQRISKSLDNLGLSPSQINAAKSRISTTFQDRAYGKKDVVASRQELADTFSALGLDENTFKRILMQTESAMKTFQLEAENFNKMIESSDSIYRVVNNGANGRDRFETVKAARRNLFANAYSTDVKSTIEFVESTLKSETPDFRMNNELRQMVVDMVKSGEDDGEILRAVRTTANRRFFTQRAKNVGYAWLDKHFPKKNGQSRVRLVDMSDNQDLEWEPDGRGGLDRLVDTLDSRMIAATYGVKYSPKSSTRPTPRSTSAPRSYQQPVTGNKVGSASSWRTNTNGDYAGAYTAHGNGNDNGAYLAFNTDQETNRLMGDIMDAASIPYRNAMDMTNSSLEKNEKDRAKAAELMTKMPERGGGFGQMMANLLHSVQLSMGTMVSSFTDFGARLFGKNGELKSFFKEQAGALKDYLFNEETGIFGNQVKALKAKGADLWERTKDQLANGYDWVYRQYYISKYGENFESSDKWLNDQQAQAMNWKKNRAAKRAQGKGSVETNPIADKLAAEANAAADEMEAALSAIGVTNDITHPEAWDGNGKSSVNSIPAATQAASKRILNAADETVKAMTGGVEPKEAQQSMKQFTRKVNDQVNKRVPKALAGGIAGAGLGMLNALGGSSLLGMLLPGGPIAGAIAGTGLSILSQTEAFKSVMFGQLDEKTGERTGGLISEKMRTAFKKAAPTMVAGAAAGALTSILKMPFGGAKGLGILGMQLLPGGVLGGAIMGMGLGMLKNNDKIKDMIFGKADDNGKRSGTWLSKIYNDFSAKKMFKGSKNEALKRGLKGAGIGALTATTMGSMGFLPSMLALGGPIGMGVAGFGIGIASSTKNFNQWLFGTEEIDPETGEPTGKKSGGFLEKVKNMIGLNVIEPVTDAFRDNFIRMIDWTKDKITEPFRLAFGPILDSILGIKDNIADFVHDKFEEIGEGVKHALTSTIKTIFSPVTRLLGSIGKTMVGALRLGGEMAMAPAAMGLKGLQLLTMGKRRKEYIDFYKQYYPQAGGMLRESWAQRSQAGEKVGMFTKASEWVQAMTGRGEIADAARAGYNAGMEGNGLNHLGWRDVNQERIDRRKQMREYNKSQRQWARVDKLRRNIRNKDLHNQEVELTPAQLRLYQKQFTRLGIDKDLIQTSDDIMQLLFHKDDFKNRADGGVGKLHGVNAMSNFRVDPVEAAAQKEASEFHSKNLNYLDTITELFKDIADDITDHNMTASFKERQNDARHRVDRNIGHILKDGKDTLTRNQKRIWKSINLRDPRLEGYNISMITDELLQEFSVSSYFNDGMSGFLKFLDIKHVKLSPRESLKDKRHAAEAAAATKAEADKKAAEAEEYDKMMRDKYVKTREFRKNGWAGYRDWLYNQENPETESETLGSKLSSVRTTIRDKIAKRFAVSGAERAGNDEMLKAMQGIEKATNAQLALDSGGQVTPDDLDKTTSNSWLAGIGKKFSNIGLFNGYFSKQQREARKAARAAREKEESAHAQALGDGKSSVNDPTADVNVTVEGGEAPKQTLFGKVLGGVSSLFGAFASTKVGGFLLKGLKFAGGIGLVAGFGLTIAELLHPGLASKLGSGLTAWNQEMSEGAKDGSLLDKVTDALSGVGTKVLDWVSNDFLGKEGYLTKAISGATTLLPTILQDFVIPGIQRSAEFISNNAETLVGAATTVITSVGPPLIETMFTVLPDVLVAAGKGLGNGLFGKSAKKKGQENLTKAQADEIKNSGGGVRDKWESVTAEEAAELEAQGYEVRKSATGYQVNRQYTLDSNVYEVDANGNAKTVGTSKQSAALNTAAKIGLHLVDNPASGLRMIGSLGKGLTRGVGALAGGALGSLGGLGGMAAGTATGFKIGGKVANALGKAGSWIGNGVKNLLHIGGKETAENVSQYAWNAAANRFVNAQTGQFVAKAVVEEAGESTAELIAKGAVDKSGEAVIKSQTSNIQKWLTKASEILSKIGDSSVVQKVAKTAPAKMFSGIISGVKNGFKSFANVLKNAITKAISNSKLLTKVSNLITDKMAALGAKTTAAIGTLGISELVFMGVGGILGAFDAPGLFGVKKSECDVKMRVISAILEALMSTTPGTYVEIALLVIQLVLGYDAKKELAAFLYKAISFDTDGSADKLQKAQDALAVERAIYNAQNGTNLSIEEYNQLANKSVVSKAIDGTIGRLWGAKNVDTKKYADAAQQYINKPGSYSIDKDGNVTFNESLGKGIGYGLGQALSDITYTTKVKLMGKLLGFDESLGNGRGAIGYGQMMSQANPAWANMPIGRFSNGQVATMGTAGCGPTAMSMVMKDIAGTPISPAAMAKYSMANGYITNGGANAGLFTEGANNLGLHGTQVNVNDLQLALRTNRPMVISGKGSGGPYTKAGHIIVARGFDRNGRVIVEDPTDGQGKAYSLSQIKNGFNTGWSYSVGYGPVDDAAYNPASSYLMGGTVTPATPYAAAQQAGTNKSTAKRGAMSAPVKDAATRKAYASLGVSNSVKARASSVKERASSQLTKSVTNENEASTYINSEGNTVEIWDKARVMAYIGESGIGFFQHMTRMSKIAQALINSIQSGKSIWEEYGLLVQNESSGSSASGADVTFGNYTDVPTSEQALEIYRFLRQQGYSAEGAAAIMGCWQAESGNKSARLEGDYLKSFPGFAKVMASSASLDKYTTGTLFKAYKNSNISINQNAYKGSDGHYYPGVGLAQWTGPRGYNLFAASKDKGLDWRTLNAQLQFFVSEMANRPTLDAKMRTANNVANAVADFFDGYEMSAGASKTLPNHYNTRKEFAQALYDKYKGVYVNGIGNGTVYDPSGSYTDHTQKVAGNISNPRSLLFNQTYLGGGPGPSGFTQLSQGFSAISNAIGRRLYDITGIDLTGSVGNSSGSSTISGISGGSGTNAQQALPRMMRSIYGQLNYSLDWDKQNPDKGTGSCASTVGWAYRKVLGLDGMSAGSTTQSKDARFTTIWTKPKGGMLPLDILQPGDILYQNQQNNGKYKNYSYAELAATLTKPISHTEMYEGANISLSHGGPNWSNKGPVAKQLNDYRRKTTFMVRRYNGFLDGSAGYGTGPSTVKMDSIAKQTMMRDGIDIRRIADSDSMKQLRPSMIMGYGPGDSMDGTESRLDKIFEIIAQWYLESKSKPASSNAAFVDASTKIIQTEKQKAAPAPEVKSKIDSLKTKHQLFAGLFD